MQKRTKVILLFSLALPTAILSFNLLTRPSTADPYFTYISAYPVGDYVQITTGEHLVIPFAFKVGEAHSQVNFEIHDMLFDKKVVSLQETTVPVRDGTATSKAIFTVTPKQRIKPGSYHLKIVARDNATGAVIRSGRIPVMVDMAEVIAKCSC